jgi:hypothetical protein
MRVPVPADYDCLKCRRIPKRTRTSPTLTVLTPVSTDDQDDQ